MMTTMKHVEFDLLAIVVEAEEIDDNAPKVQISDIWYTSDDFRAMRRRDRKLSLSLSKGRKDGITGIYGVESREQRHRRHKRMKSALLGVLLEQERQYDEHDSIVDESSIALEYSKYTRESRIEAHQRAKKNERSLRMGNNSNHSSSSSSSKSSRRHPRYSKESIYCNRKSLLLEQEEQEAKRRYKSSSPLPPDFVEDDLYTISLTDTTETSTSSKARQYHYTTTSRFSSRSPKRHLLRLATLRNTEEQERK